MKNGKQLKAGVLSAALILTLTLCGCGEIKTIDNTAPVTAAPAVSAAPAATVLSPVPETPAPVRALSEIYGSTAADNIYDLSQVGIEGCGIDAACLKDGYVLLVMREYSEQGYENESGTQHLLSNGRLVLFPLHNPESAVSLALDRLYGKYSLMDGGNVLGVGWDGSWSLYNSRLEEVYKQSEGCGRFLGASGDGDIWFLNDQSEFVLRRGGEEFPAIEAEGMLSGTYLGNVGGRACFEMFNQYYGQTRVAVDIEQGTFTEYALPGDSCEFCGGYISYTDEYKWYIAGLDDPFVVTAFARQDAEESAFAMDGNYLVSQSYKHDPSANRYYWDFAVYDMQSGGICCRLSGPGLSDFDTTICAYDDGMILLKTHDRTEAAKGLYLWDISGLQAVEPAAVYETLDFHIDQSRIDSLIREINELYGVSVYYDAEHLKEYSAGYELTECTDIDLLGRTLVKLKECMAEYPVGFFEEIKGDSINEVVYCLCDAHVRTDMDSIEDAAATVSTMGDTLRMSYDVHYWASLRRHFLHENTHMMETRIEEHMQKINNWNYTRYWYLELNRPDCPPIQHYIFERTPENLKGIYELDGENACYIDWYSKCTINEDHARILENSIFPASAHYYDAPYIDRKDRFLNAVIRDSFPCVQYSSDVLWEQRTGPVDLYSEFPDFINGR